MEKRHIAAPAVAAGLVAATLLGLQGVAHAQIPCGHTNRVGPQGATVYRTASGFTPNGKHVPANTNIDTGQIRGNRVEAVGWGGYIAVARLTENRDATCF